MLKKRKSYLLKIMLPSTVIFCCSAVAIITIDRANGAAATLDQPLVAATSLENQSKPIDSVDVRFKDLGNDEMPDFQKHVAPLLGRLGCNGRSCHGSFQGQRAPQRGARRGAGCGVATSRHGHGLSVSSDEPTSFKVRECQDAGEYRRCEHLAAAHGRAQPLGRHP